MTEPPIDAPRDPLYKSERDVLKVLIELNYEFDFILCNYVMGRTVGP